MAIDCEAHSSTLSDDGCVVASQGCIFLLPFAFQLFVFHVCIEKSSMERRKLLLGHTARLGKWRQAFELTHIQKKEKEGLLCMRQVCARVLLCWSYAWRHKLCNAIPNSCHQQ